MTEEDKKQVAAFRFGVICELVNGTDLQPGEQQRLIRQKCSRKWQIPFSEKTRIGRSTILRWVRLYKASNHKLESLYPQDRSDRGKSRSLDEETCLALTQLRQELPEATVARLIEQMHQRGLVGAGIQLKASSVYRFLHEHNLMNPAAVGLCGNRRHQAGRGTPGERIGRPEIKRPSGRRIGRGAGGGSVQANARPGRRPPGRPRC